MDWNIHGHDWAADMLRQHIVNGNMRHAYLFSGPAGVGRRTLALRFAQVVNCTQPPAPGEACGKCQTCKQVDCMQQADLALVQAEEGSALKVGQVRNLRHFVSLAPYTSNYRIALLLNFQQANANAQNALLKTLEEPNPKVLMLVTVDDAENLLPTITSRCELIRLRPMDVEALSALLQEELALDTEKANLIARIAGGRVGYAKQLAESEELMEERREWLENLLALIAAGKAARFDYSRKHTKNNYIKRREAKKQLLVGMPYWLSFWRDVLLITTGSETSITNIDLISEIECVAAAVGAADAECAIRALEHAFVRIQNANLQLMLDNILLDWPTVNISNLAQQ